jgi:anti-sigma B factor antagonist
VKITIAHEHDVPVVHVDGEVDALTARKLVGAVHDAAPNTVLGVVLDLRDTTFLDSAGLGVIVQIARRLAQREQQMHVVVAPESFVGDVLVETGFTSLADVHTDLADAIGGIRALV